MIPAKVKNFLNKNKIKYDVVKHKTVYTAYDLAQTLKKKLNEVVKALVVKTDKEHAIVLLPASHQVDFKALKKETGAKKVEIDKENIMTKLFKVKPGAISAMHGPLHKIPVYVDKAVLKTQKVVAQAGSFEESLHLKAKDLVKAVGGKLVNFAKKK
ncbi:MAG: YbaK/EbsC family protein [Patescibacteria group bacterium]